jgi:hypothetical protein
VIILVYYLYFSELKRVRYEFSKYWLFSEICTEQIKLFVPNLTYTTASRCHWLVGPKTHHLPWGHDRVKPFDSVKDDVTAPGTHRSLSNSITQCELEHVVVWNRIRRSTRVWGCQCHWVLVPRTSPAVSLLLELCPRGNNKDVIIIILVHDNAYIPC